MHFFESSIITTKDCLHCQVYGNEHPTKGILVKPKYIPTDITESEALPYRFISGKKMNRLNLWTDGEKLKEYIENFKKSYPDYVYKSEVHTGERLFFQVPIDKIERVYYPKTGAQELMSMKKKDLDDHLRAVHDFIEFLLKSGVSQEDMGVTYSTLMGHYFAKISDINIVIYGKENFWKVMNYLEDATHEDMRWKTQEEWENYYNKRNRYAVFEKEQFIKDMMRKKSEGFFRDTLFVIFGTETEDETWFKWGKEQYSECAFAKVEGEVVDHFSSVVRPGCYEIKDSKVLEGHDDVPVKQIVFYSRDYCMMACPGETIEAQGILEKVTRGDEVFYRLVVGYFDAYTQGRREQEYIRTK